MPKSKSHSISDDSNASESHQVRKRTVKACQRCRLKKCKCDGLTPCTRCKSDDAICSYGRHKKSDKIVFRKGYVQMLERQHIQFIAGLQELYRLTSTGQSWPGPLLDCSQHGQPLTHKILEGLGVLRTDEWDDPHSDYTAPKWDSFEQQELDGTGAMYPDDMSEGTMSSTTATFSPTTTSQGMQPAFPNSTIMTNRRKNKFGNPVMPISQATTMSGLNSTLPMHHHHRVKQPSNNKNAVDAKQSSRSNQPQPRSLVKTEGGYYNSSLNRDLSLQIPQSTSTTYDNIMYPYCHGEMPPLNGNLPHTAADNLSYEDLTWMSDIFDPSTNLNTHQQDLPCLQSVR